MRIDYDRLRELLEQWQHGDEVRDQLEAQWDMELAAPDMARELLALRDEIEKTRDRIKDEIERTPVELQSARITLHTERVHMLALCTHLLNGDYE